MLYGIVLVVHVCAMLAALLGFLVSELLLIFARRGQSSSLNKAVLAIGSANLAATIGVVAGVILVFLGGWSLLTPWLLASLVLIAVLMVVVRKLVRPWQGRVQSALRSAASSTEIKVFASESTALIGRITVIALFVGVAGLMAIKPDLAL